MQDDFDSGMGMPDDDLTGGSPTPEMGGGAGESEMGGGSQGRRESGGARARKSSGARKSGGGRKRAVKRAGARKSSRKGAKKGGRMAARKAAVPVLIWCPVAARTVPRCARWGLLVYGNPMGCRLLGPKSSSPYRVIRSASRSYS